MVLTNLTRANEIGANCYRLDWNGASFLLDAGMHPRMAGPSATPLLSGIPHGKPGALLLTHAHLDHLGAVPLAVRRLGAPILTTAPTALLADPLLRNSANIMRKQAEERADTTIRHYSHADVDHTLKLLRPCPAHKALPLDELAGAPGISLEFRDAGHILGSAGVLLRDSSKSLFYTGDVNLTDQTLARAADFPTEHVDVLLLECTRGAHPAEPGFSRDGEIQRLAYSINGVFQRGGAVLIPVFALGKTQEALAAIHLLRQAGDLPRVPVFIGGLSWRLTQIYDQLASKSRRHHPGLSLLEEVRPQLLDGRAAANLRPRRGQIYLLSSGMMTEKTLSNILGQRMLAEQRHGIFFIGYTDPESPAGKLRAAAAAGRPASLDPAFGPQPVRCAVDHFDLTAHAQRDGLLEYAETLNPATVVLIHGDPPALESMRAEIQARRPATRVVIPPPGQPIDLAP